MSRFLGELLYADDLSFVRESFEGLKESQKGQEEVLELKELRINLKEDMIIGSEIAGKVTEEGKFP